VEFRLLGSVEVDADGCLLDVGEPRRRAVLAGLLVDAGAVVTASTLIDRVWGDGSPDQARRTLATHVTRLRRVLEHRPHDDAPVRVVNQFGGYRLAVDRDRVDLHRFRQLAAAGRTPGWSDEQRVELWRQALAQWRGEPLTGIGGAWAHRMREQLIRERLEATVGWAEAELQVGNPAGVLGPLAELAAEHPEMEPLTVMRARALVAAGRPNEALECCRIHRQRLVEEFGTDQGPALRTLYEAILRDDEALARPIAFVGGRPAPRQLPAAAHHFVGRGTELAALNGCLDGHSDTSGVVVISAIGGTAGVGKTALAVHWAHQVAHQFPDGQLYLDLRGFGPGSMMAPTEALRRLLEALAVVPHRIPADVDAQAALYRSEVAGRRMLVVLDNARDSAQVQPLLPAAAGCQVVVTSRHQLSGLAAGGANLIDLDLLPVSGARDFLGRRLGPQRIAAESAAVEEIIEHCARLPLALTLVAARAMVRPGESLQQLARGLRDAELRWVTLTSDDPRTDVRTVFSWSYDALTVAAARLFRLFGMHPGPHISAPAAASLAGLAPAAVRLLLDELARAGLLTEHLPGRYSCHDLLRAYATHLAWTTETDEERQQALGRALDHYLHTAYRADLLLNPARDPLPLAAPRAGVTLEHLADFGAAMAWFAAHRPLLLAAIGDAVAAGFDTHVWQLASTMWTFLYRSGHWPDQATVGQSAVAAARRLGEPAVCAHAHRILGGAYLQCGRFGEAHVELSHALDQAAGADDHIQQAHIHCHLAVVLARWSRPAEALGHARLALELYQTTGHRAGQADARGAIGWYHALLGQPYQALAHCQRALALHEQLDNRTGQAKTWDTIGYAYHRLGRHHHARTCYQRALALFQDLGDRLYEAATLNHLAEIHDVTGDSAPARDLWCRALRILDDLEHPDASNIRAQLARVDGVTSFG
jgi:DNA-binding SARP family transcriptional activator/tetratricopeptide (TPR) repeat protein